MHHKFCLLMISVKTLTSSLRSIASMLFVSSLRLVVALNEEGFSLNLLPPLHALKVFFFKKQKSACLNLVREINPVFSKDEMPMEHQEEELSYFKEISFRFPNMKTSLVECLH